MIELAGWKVPVERAASESRRKSAKGNIKERERSVQQYVKRVFGLQVWGYTARLDLHVVDF